MKSSRYGYTLYPLWGIPYLILGILFKAHYSALSVPQILHDIGAAIAGSLVLFILSFEELENVKSTLRAFLSFSRLIVYMWILFNINSYVVLIFLMTIYRNLICVLEYNERIKTILRTSKIPKWDDPKRLNRLCYPFLLFYLFLAHWHYTEKNYQSFIDDLLIIYFIGFGILCNFVTQQYIATLPPPNDTPAVAEAA